MTKDQLIECYEYCLNQGWVHNTPIDDVFNEYSVRNDLFNRHLRNIEDNNSENIHILIGEAPPYYPNSTFPDPNDRTYFYSRNDSKKSKRTGYFKEPCKYFLNEHYRNNLKTTKDELLLELAKKGVLIFDIFPFPVYQSTGVRRSIKKSSVINNNEVVSTQFFNDFLSDYFGPRLQYLINEFANKNIHLYMFAPKVTSVQFLHWIKHQECFVEKLVKFNGGLNFNLDRFGTNFENSSMTNFINGIESDEVKRDYFIDFLKKIPIFMNGSGNPSFDNFVNGSI